MRHITRFALIVAGVGSALGSREAAAQSVHTDEAYGFSIRVPKGFRSVPINMAEKWIVAKFIYKRALAPKTIGISMTPEIRVIVFPKVDVKEVAAARTEKAKKLAVKDENGKITYVNLLEFLQNPFQSYHEYLRENYDKGGWFVAEEKDTTINGLPAVYKRIDVDDKMRWGQKSTVQSWEIDYGDAIYVVQFEVIKDYDHKFEREIIGTAASFEKRPRTEALRPVLTGSPSTERRKEVLAAAKDEELSEKERFLARQADLERAIAKAEEELPEGWHTYEHGPFTVFHSTPARFARRVSEQAALMWEWMEEHFGYVGEGAAVGSILRICKNASEAQSYTDTSTRSDFSMTAREIVVWDDRDWGWGAFGSGKLNARIAMQFLADKNRRLWYGLPPWLDHGLVIYIGSLKMKGRKMVAKPDEWDMEAIRGRLREDRFKPPQEVLRASWEDYNAATADSADRVQSLAMVNFLFETRNKAYRDTLHQYIALLDERLREFEDGRTLHLTAKTGTERDKELAAWLAEWEKQRDAIYEECFERVFGGWSERAWAKFDHAWKNVY